MPWLGLKKLAFIPLSRTNASPPDVIPDDWAEKILQKVYSAKDPTTGADISVRTYIRTVSSGLADLEVEVQPPQTIDGQDIKPDALEATQGNQLRAQGFDGAAIVMLGGPFGGSTKDYWSRFVMRDDLANWVGELVHQTALCDLPDLFDNTSEYPGEGMGNFDQEASQPYSATHFCAWTKRAIQWIDPSTVALHHGGSVEYTLHSISLMQPPPDGSIAALQIGKQAPYLMVEARLRADQFDINISSEGVIVYEVQTADPLGRVPPHVPPPLNLLTKTALTEGQAFTTADSIVVQVTGSVPGGFSIYVYPAPQYTQGPDLSYVVPILL